MQSIKTLFQKRKTGFGKMLACVVILLLIVGGKVLAGGNTNTTPGVSSGTNTTNRLTPPSNTLTSSNKAYGDNMKEVEPGVFAIYSGDVNQDGYIATDDVSYIDNDNLQGVSGNYLVMDLNGDTYVDTYDVTVCDNNNLMGISIQRP